MYFTVLAHFGEKEKDLYYYSKLCMQIYFTYYIYVACHEVTRTIKIQIQYLRL